MARWVVGSILHGVDPLSYFSFQPVLHDWCNKGRGMCYPVCGMVHIKEPLLLIDKSSLCGGSGFPFSLSEWSLTICLTPYNCKSRVSAKNILLYTMHLRQIMEARYTLSLTTLQLCPVWGARCSFVARVFAHGAILHGGAN